MAARRAAGRRDGAGALACARWIAVAAALGAVLALASDRATAPAAGRRPGRTRLPPDALVADPVPRGGGARAVRTLGASTSLLALRRRAGPGDDRNARAGDAGGPRARVGAPAARAGDDRARPRRRTAAGRLRRPRAEAPCAFARRAPSPPWWGRCLPSKQRGSGSRVAVARGRVRTEDAGGQRLARWPPAAAGRARTGGRSRSPTSSRRPWSATKATGRPVPPDGRPAAPSEPARPTVGPPAPAEPVAAAARVSRPVDSGVAVRRGRGGHARAFRRPGAPHTQDDRRPAIGTARSVRRRSSISRGSRSPAATARKRAGRWRACRAQSAIRPSRRPPRISAAGSRSRHGAPPIATAGIRACPARPLPRIRVSRARATKPTYRRSQLGTALARDPDSTRPHAPKTLAALKAALHATSIADSY